MLRKNSVSFLKQDYEDYLRALGPLHPSVLIRKNRLDRALMADTRRVPEDDEIFIKFPSHRQRDRFIQDYGDRQQYYSFSRDNDHGVVKVTLDELERLKEDRIKFKRVPRVDRLGNEWMKCW